MDHDYIVDRDLALHSLHHRQQKLAVQLTAAWRRWDFDAIAALDTQALMLAAEADLLDA